MPEIQTPPSSMLPDFDPASLVVDETPATETAQVETKVETPAETSAAPETVNAENAGAVKVVAEVPAAQPATAGAAGTPDKAMQKLQQDLSAANRKIDALTEKLESGQSLTGAERQQLETAKRKVDAVREAIAANGFDPIEHGQAIAETVVEQDKAVQGLTQTVAELKARLDRTEGANAESTATATWSAAEKQYAGVNVQDVWEKASKDAIALVGENNPALRKVASKYFHERCGAAAKQIANKKPEIPATAPKITPNGARVTENKGVIAAPAMETPEQEYLRTARALVV